MTSVRISKTKRRECQFPEHVQIQSIATLSELLQFFCFPLYPQVLYVLEIESLDRGAVVQNALKLFAARYETFYS